MIKIDNITKSFRRTRVLDNLSLHIGAQDRIAIIGSNGAGKTTLIRCLLGQYLHKGTINFEGADPRKARRTVLDKIGFVPQIAPPLKMPVGELVRFSAAISNIDKRTIETVGERLEVDFGALANRSFVKLSGGQKQKILIAIAISRKPRLIIMDEPTANLDPHARQILFDLLSERGELPVIISSHRLEEVAGLVNRVIEMDQGKIVLDDAVEDSGDISTRIPCRIMLNHLDDAFSKTIGEWRFVAIETEVVWQGEVAGADRLRFFGMLARYSGLIKGIEMGEYRYNKGGDND